MPNRMTWDWMAVEPDRTVTMTLLFNRTPKDDGRKEGADYDWHRYPVKVNGDQYTMFAPSEQMHSALETLGVSKRGDAFRVTKRLGYNKETGKSYTFYELEKDGTRLRTDQLGEADTSPTPQQQVERVIKETVQATELKELHERAFRAVMDNVFEYLQEWCPTCFEDRQNPEQQEKIVQLIIGVLPHIGMQVCNLVNWSGGKK